MRINNALPVVSLSRIDAAASAGREEKLRAACREFEALFMQQMLKGMRATIPQSGLLEKDASHDMYTDLLDAQVARGVAEQHGGMGIANALYRQLQKLEHGPVSPLPKESPIRTDRSGGG
ncbi:rod-binding protein [Geothermobacter hydrogeniphilus]|uniref:Flagellar protein FlgJ N-terminal domain-containing protein n=1 Tax=Geothermobacter hydrogeniphilus TaxID=1969733 RepID=A0A1X0YEE9_9BACT|nr:rod-binding protein [Geothermobacter hydrogeniphilus]ORJ63497.1 hypothetical protein B5V00_01125 [Geothermobacter hydrogeniphilus]